MAKNDHWLNKKSTHWLTDFPKKVGTLNFISSCANNYIALPPSGIPFNLHRIVKTSVFARKAHVELIREMRSFRRYNKQQFHNEVASIPRSVVESFDCLNNAVFAWKTLFVDAANRHAPIKKLRMKGTIKPLFTKELSYQEVDKKSGSRNIKAAEAASYYKNLIEFSLGPKETWRTLNSVWVTR